MPGNRGRERWKARMQFLWAVWQAFSRNNGPIAASAIALYLLLALVPALLLLVSVMAFFVTPTQVQLAMARMTAELGPAIGQALQSQVLSIVNHRALLSGLSLLFGLWSGSAVFVTIADALNMIWHTERRRSLWASYGLAFLMTILLGVLIGVILAVTSFLHWMGISYAAWSGGSTSYLAEISAVLLSSLVDYLVITVVFILIYTILPTRRLPWRSLLTGALVAGALWVLLLQLFTWYAVHIGDYQVVYGSLGGVVLLILWFNYSAEVMLLGAELAMVVNRVAGRESEQRVGEQ